MASSIADIRTSAGSKFYVTATPPVTYDSAGFSALTFTEVLYISNLGEFGAVSNLVTFNSLGNRTVIKRKGSKDNGSIPVEMARVPGDAGQTLLVAAAASDLSYSYKLETQDGTLFYFSSQCMSYTTNVGGVDDILMATATLEIDNEIIEV